MVCDFVLMNTQEEPLRRRDVGAIDPHGMDQRRWDFCWCDVDRAKLDPDQTEWDCIRCAWSPRPVRVWPEIWGSGRALNFGILDGELDG